MSLEKSPSPRDEAASALELAARRALGEGTSLLEVTSDAALSDSTRKFQVRDRAGRAIAMALLSSATSAQMIARSSRRARDVRDALGESLGAAVLLPLAEGEAVGRSFALLPWCTPLRAGGLAARAQRFVIRARLLRWLAAATARTARDVPAPERERRVAAPLARMAGDADLPAPLRELASRALAALRAGDWVPKHVFMHDDLWSGNVLIDQRTRGGATFGELRIIDWAGARLDGFPLYDFLRVACDMRLSGGAFRRALDRQCAALACGREHAPHHLAAALADLGGRLEQWPRAAFAKTAASCYERLRTGS
ncbi:MAG TPA: phosphotransferase [Myxococcota bacterium]|nr:phosphotransferase [Myxococcota bacterium]